MNGWTLEPDDHHAVGDAAGEADHEAGAEPEEHGDDRIERSCRAQHHRHDDAGERVDGAGREIDAAGDDDDRRADAHDREAAGVGRHLEQRVRVEEVVDRRAGHRIDVRAGGERESGGRDEDDEREARPAASAATLPARRRPAGDVGTINNSFSDGSGRGEYECEG